LTAEATAVTASSYHREIKNYLTRPEAPERGRDPTRGRRRVLVRPSRRLLGALAAGTLAVGYGDLVRGGISLGPVLLVIAYCALIPATILGPSPREGATQGDQSDAPSFRTAAALALGVFLLYLATLAPSTTFWDTSEYMAAAYTLGLPHPPGNPLFVLLGRVFAMLPIAGSVAVRINILAAASSALSAGIWFLLAERATSGWLSHRWQRRCAGVLGAVIGATAFTVWNQSVVNEKVYTVSLVGLAVVSWLAIRWTEQPAHARADRLLVLMAYLCGLGYSNHMAGLLPLPALAVVVLVYQPRALLRARLVAACAGAMLLGLTPFATQPIRAAHNPPLNEGEPTACRTGLQLGCTLSRGTFDAFTYNLNREQYRKPPLAERQAPFSAQVGMWWQYFRWQWLRDAHLEHQTAQGVLAAVFLVLGVLGAWAHFRGDRRSFWYFGTFVVTLTLVLIYYLNFRYGASQAPALGDSVPREVRDRDYFFLWSFSAWGVWAGPGLMMVWESVASLAGARSERSRPALHARFRVMSAPVVALALVPLLLNWSSASRRGDETAIAFARDLLNSVEPYGVLVTMGDNDTFPLWYAQEVEGIRRDVTVAVLSLLNTDWFIRGIIRRPGHPYDETRGPAIFRGRHWPKPEGPPVRLSLAEADSLPQYVIVKEPVRFRHAGLDVSIDPRNLPQDGAGGGFLERADLIVLRMIADSWPARPVYLSRTTADYGFRLGFGAHLLSQGLARKLMLPSEGPRDTVMVQGSGWLDVPGTLSLWTEEFRGPAAIIRHGDWIDRPSVSIPFSYLLTGMELAEALRMRGDTARAQEVMQAVAGVARAARTGPSLEQLIR
jgi:hypothetical protein